MTAKEFDAILAKDSYLKPRRAPSEADQQLYLREVDFHCPLCGKDLRNRRQKKGNKLYEIAHIYPNRPTQEQYNQLQGLKRLGADSESYENKIALCKDCHGTQDYHTTKDDYLLLLQKKETLLLSASLQEITSDLDLENDIALIVSTLPTISDDDILELNYSPVAITKKFGKGEKLLKSRITTYVTEYYPYIREQFKSMDGINGFCIDVLSMQIKSAFLKMESLTDDKEQIFNHLVDWIKLKTLSNSQSACEAVISFFVQNCEVFYEITK